MNLFQSMFNLFRKENDYDIQFIDSGDQTTYNYAPPVLAKDVPPLKEYQLQKYKKYKFPACPGMYDFATAGYIIPAWANLWLKANDAGNVGFVNFERTELPNVPKSDRVTISESMGVHNFDPSVVDGLFTYKHQSPHAYNFNTPWKIIAKKEISFLVLPAYMHNSKFNDEVFGYPGILNFTPDFGFHTVNLVLSAREKTEVVFKVGEPVLHLIPLQMPRIYKASYGFISPEHHIIFKRNANFVLSHFYQKFYQQKKKYSLEKRKEIIELEKNFKSKDK